MRIAVAALTVTAIVWPSAADAQAPSVRNGPIVFTASSGWQVPFTWRPWTAYPGVLRATDEAGSREVGLLGRGHLHPAFSQDGRRLAFLRSPSLVRSSHIAVASADGRGERRVAGSSYADGRPAWSPDGTRIAFRRGFERPGIYVVAAGGGDARRLTEGRSDMSPAWGPGDRIVFVRVRANRWVLHAVSAHGGPVTPLTDGRIHAEDPAWSPDGSLIAFSGRSADRIDVFTVRPDGGDLRRVTAAGPDEANRLPAWSPDGTRIVLSAWGPFGNDHELVLVDADGGASRRLTDNRVDDLDPAWGALPQQATARTATVHRTVQRRRNRSSLNRRRRKPAGLATWLRQPQAGNGSACRAGSDRRSSGLPWPVGPVLTFHSHESEVEVFHGGRLEAGARGFLCGYGLPRTGRRVDLRLVDRAGRSTRLLMMRNHFGVRDIAYWVPRPGDEGDYVVVGRRGGREARTTLRVVPAERPHLSIVHPSGVSTPTLGLGRPVGVLVTGLAPGARFSLDLYRRSGADVWPRYLNSIDLVADGRGNLLHRIPTSRRDRPTDYWVVLRVGRRQTGLREPFLAVRR